MVSFFRRIFGKRANKATTVCDEVYFAIGQAITESGLSEIDQHIVLSIVSAGCGSAGRVYELCDEQLRRFGHVTFERVLPFAEVFTMAMVSRWVRHVHDQSAEFDRPAMWAHLAKSVMNLFGTSSDARFEEARLMDVQFNADTDARQARRDSAGIGGLTEADMLISLAARSLGRELGGKLASPPIPVKGSYQLWKGTGIEAFTTDITILTVHDALLANEAGMYASFKALQQG